MLLLRKAIEHDDSETKLKDNKLTQFYAKGVEANMSFLQIIINVHWPSIARIVTLSIIEIEILTNLKKQKKQKFTKKHSVPLQSE